MTLYLAKALLSRQGTPATLRFIPLEIFDLWKTHMQNAHDYQVRLVQVSLWVATDQDSGEASRQPAGAKEPVVRVSIFRKVSGIDVPVERYFAEEEIEGVLPKFLAHYGLKSADAMGTSQVRLKRGVLLPPEDMFEDEL